MPSVLLPTRSPHRHADPGQAYARQHALLLSHGRDVNQDWNHHINLAVNHQGKQYIEVLNLGWTAPRTITNLLDEIHAANSFIITFANSCVVWLGERWTYGLIGRYRF